MEDLELQQLWKSYDERLQEQLVFNRKNASDITKMKVKSELASMRPIKIFTLLLGILWVLFLDVLLVNLYHVGSLFFLISFGFISLGNKISVGIYGYLLLISSIVSINSPVISTCFLFTSDAAAYVLRLDSFGSHNYPKQHTNSTS